MDKILLPDEIDDEGFKACKICHSRNILTSGKNIDEVYIICIDCLFTTDTGYFYFVLNQWNQNIDIKLP